MGLQHVAQMRMDDPASGTTKNISDKKYLQKGIHSSLKA